MSELRRRCLGGLRAWAMPAVTVTLLIVLGMTVGCAPSLISQGPNTFDGSAPKRGVRYYLGKDVVVIEAEVTETREVRVKEDLTIVKKTKFTSTEGEVRLETMPDQRSFYSLDLEPGKASDNSLWRLRAAANRTVSIMNGILRDAVAQGDLAFDEYRRQEDLVYHMWLLGDAGKASSSSWLPPSEMGVSNPFTSIIRSTQMLGDAYGWKPLSTEWDYEETRARIHREVFPTEMRKVHGIRTHEAVPGSLE